MPDAESINPLSGRRDDGPQYDRVVECFQVVHRGRDEITWVRGHLPGEVTAGAEKAAQLMVDELGAQRPELAEVAVDVRALIGRPAKVLIEQARDAELLVLGHRGRGEFASAVLGSVGLQCAARTRASHGRPGRTVEQAKGLNQFSAAGNEPLLRGG